MAKAKKKGYLVLKIDDIDKFLTPWYKKQLDLIVRRIERNREAIGKSAKNTYLVVNQDETFIGQLLSVMRDNGVKI